ncbi:outer membrane beta-barrel protein [Thermodesulfobacteriota bacterium]
MRFQKGFLLLLSITFLVLSFPKAGLSQGKAIVKPSVSTSWRTDDNFYKAENNERDIYTYLVQPGIELGYETAKSLLSLKYTLNAFYHDDQDPLRPGELPADIEDYKGHTGTLNLQTSPTDRLTLGLEDSYTLTRDPGSSDVFSNSIDRDKYYINTLTPSISYGFGPKFTAGLKYRHTETDYDVAAREDSTEERPIFDLIYNLDKTTSLDLEYQHWTRDYDLVTSDYTSEQVKLVFRKQYKYFALEGGGGYHERQFDDPTLRDIDVFTYRFGLVGQNPPAPEAKPRSRIAIGAESNLNNSGSGDSYFTADRYILDAGYVYKEKVPLNVRVSYQVSDYERTLGLTRSGTTELRDENTLTLEGSIGYIVTDWLLFTVTAGDEERESNHAGRDYENRYFMAKLDFRYDLGKR